MKQELKIDHTKPTLTEALGVEKFSLALKMTACAAKYMTDEGSKYSHMAQEMHDILSYNEILFAAAAHLTHVLKESMQDFKDSDLGLDLRNMN